MSLIGVPRGASSLVPRVRVLSLSDIFGCVSMSSVLLSTVRILRMQVKEGRGEKRGERS